jgi:hypothetical protein
VGQRTTATVAILAGVLLAVTGCDTIAGGPVTPETTTDAVAATEALWDPCTQISDDVLRQVGVDPATRDNTISGVENVKGWKLCSWHNKKSRWDYTLGVWSTTHTVEDLKGDANNVDFTNITVSGRPGTQFRKAHDAHNSVCYFGFPFSAGTIEISVFGSAASDADLDPCQTASTAAETLVHQFPD